MVSTVLNASSIPCLVHCRASGGADYLHFVAGVPIVPVVCENYHHLFDGKTRFRRGTLRIKGQLCASPEGSLLTHRSPPADIDERSDRIRRPIPGREDPRSHAIRPRGTIIGFRGLDPSCTRLVTFPPACQRISAEQRVPSHLPGCFLARGCSRYTA